MKKINKPRILERLRSRFDLTDLEKELFTLFESVSLVTDVDELLKTWKCILVGNFSRTAIAGAGSVAAYSVPDGKRYHIRAFDIVRLAGDGIIDFIYTHKEYLVKIASQAASASFSSLLLTQDIILDEGMSLYVNVSVISTDSTWEVKFYYSEEDAF